MLPLICAAPSGLFVRGHFDCGFSIIVSLLRSWNCGNDEYAVFEIRAILNDFGVFFNEN